MEFNISSMQEVLRIKIYYTRIHNFEFDITDFTLSDLEELQHFTGHQSILIL